MKSLFRALIQSKLFKDSFLFSTFSFLNSGLNFVLLIVLARFLSVEGYGNLNLYSIFITLVGFIITLNTNGYLSVVFFNKGREYINQVINIVIFISIAVTLFLFIIFVLFDPLSNLIGLRGFLLYISLLICLFQSITSLFLDLLRLEDSVKMYGIVSVLQVFFNVALTIIFIIILQIGWESRVYAQFLVSILFFSNSLILLYKRGYLNCFKISRDILLRALSFGLPLIPHAISSWIRQGFDRYVINNVYDIGVVGIYSLSFNIANIIHLVGYAFNSANSIYIYKLLAQNKDESAVKLSRLTNGMIVFFVLLTIIVCFASYYFIPILFPQYFISLSTLLPLCISSMFQCLYYLFVNYIFYFQKTKILMYITFSVSLTHLLLSIWLTKYSVTFVALINLVSNAIILMLVYYYSQRLYKLKFRT